MSIGVRGWRVHVNLSNSFEGQLKIPACIFNSEIGCVRFSGRD